MVYKNVDHNILQSGADYKSGAFSLEDFRRDIVNFTNQKAGPHSCPLGRFSALTS